MTAIDHRTKLKLIRWLVDDVSLISPTLSIDRLTADLPKFCRSGVLLGDLLNRLHGREQIIKGLNRNPKNFTAITANFDKSFSYLREFPRFSSRYLWAQALIIEGNEDVTWGLLDDIWYWSQNKISPHDPVATLVLGDGSAMATKRVSQDVGTAVMGTSKNKKTQEYLQPLSNLSPGRGQRSLANFGQKSEPFFDG